MCRAVVGVLVDEWKVLRISCVVWRGFSDGSITWDLGVKEEIRVVRKVFRILHEMQTR